VCADMPKYTEHRRPKGSVFPHLRVVSLGYHVILVDGVGALGNVQSTKDSQQNGSAAASLAGSQSKSLDSHVDGNRK